MGTEKSDAEKLEKQIRETIENFLIEEVGQDQSVDPGTLIDWLIEEKIPHIKISIRN